MKTKISIFLLLILLFSSCENGINHSGSEQNNSSSHTSEKTLVVISGSLKIDKNTVHEKSTARNAIPSVPYVYSTDDDYEYFVQAISSNGLTHEVIADPENFNYYEISLEWGERWSISAGMRKKADNSIIMLDADSASGKALSFLFDNDNLFYSFNFILQPLQRAGKGRVELSMQKIPVDSVTGEDCVTELKLYITKDGSLQEWFPDLIQVSIDSSNEDNNYIKSIGTDYNIPSGSYDVTFIYYKTYTSQSPAIKLPVYITHQVINVYDNLKTTEWTNYSYNSEYDIINSSGTFRLTEELIRQFASTTFYVGNTGVGEAPSDTSGSGSPYAPLKTLKKAAEIIKTINDGSSPYRLYICEDQDLSDLTESLSLVPNDKAINLTIQGFDPQNSERQFILSGYNESSQKSQFDGAFIKIAGKSNTDTIVTLRNLSIYGHKNTLSSVSNGGGLLCSQAKVLLENVDIRDNECGEKGAGIFATSSSIVTIKDSYIEGNIVTDPDKAFGAGIALMAGATVYIEGNTHILENESAKDGGGIGVSETGNNKLYINDGHIYGNTAVNGGGVYNNKELYFSAGGISQNTATALGGGVYSTGSMFMYGSAVIGDSAKTTAATDLAHSNMAGAKGGGIYSTGNLYLGYSSWTSESENTPASLTGGVFYNYSLDTGGIHQYADNTSYLFKMNSGSVSYNAGRGIYVGKCTFSMTGGTVQGNTAIKGSDLNTEYQLNGAGLYAGTGATITVSGGTITENHAEENGGGLYTAQNDSIIILQGGTISSNTADDKGNGIAIANGYLKMKGDALVDAGNDVYLADGRIIQITEALTATSSVAKVNLSAWSRGTTVVQADGTKVTDLTPYKDYFAFTQEGWKPKVSVDKLTFFADAPIYVAGQTLHPYCGVAGSDESGDGTKLKPFATIDKAIELMDNKSVDYIIYIDGSVTGKQTIPDTLTNTDSGTYNAQSIIIEGVNGLNSTKIPKDELNGNQIGTTLKVESNVPVSITNLKISGGKDSNGGGLYVGSSSSTVKLLDGTLITENEATLGGGVYNTGSLYISGSAMIGKSTNSIATSSSYGNKATQRGAGICSIAGAKLYLGYTSWTSDSVNTTAELTGGVCKNYLANTANASAQGGGIYNKGSIYFASGNVSYNYALNGAGIYTEESVTMSGGTIEGNEGDSTNGSGCGGGIHVSGNDKSITMSGYAKIQNNKNIALGAGVYLYYTNCKLIVKDNASISGNIAETNGGAVYMHDMTSAHASVEVAGGATITYGGAKKNNDIFMLDSNTKVTITQSLSARAASVVIGLTPREYTVGRILLEADTGVPLADQVGKFTVTPDGENPTADWFITSGGTLGTPLDAEQVTSENYDTVTRIKVTSAAGMNKIATLSNAGKNFEGKTITLFDDVTLTTSFTPIGPDSNNVFKGTFDGNNKTVSGLSGQNALFNYVGGGTIKDLTVEGSSTNAGIVNRLNSGRIEGCKSYVSVTHTGGSEAGGIAAFCLSGTIINCVNYGTVISKGDGLGGILGYQQGSGVVDSCVNKGAVQSTGAGMTGGIAGLAFGNVRNCINTGEVSASTAVVGGIVGNEHCAVTNNGVFNCANLASVSGTYCVGGIAGVCDLSSSLDYIAIVKNCFNAGTVSITDSSKTSVGGVIGEILTGGSGTCTLVSNYYAAGTAADGIGADNGVTVEAPRAMVPSIDQMNEWVNANNSVELYKTWTLKVVDGVTLPVLDVGYEW